MLTLFLKSKFVVMLKRFRLVNALMLLLGGSFCMNAPLFAESLGINVGQQQENCNGVVTDATGESVIGASVMIKGTTVGTVTDLDGRFTLPGVKVGDVIQISFIGYVTQEIKWNGKPMSVTLKEDSQALEEVVVVGYGTQKKSESDRCGCHDRRRYVGRPSDCQPGSRFAGSHSKLEYYDAEW